MKKEKNTSNLVGRIIQIAVLGEEHKIRSLSGKCQNSSCLRAPVGERERGEEIDALALRLS
jgi:hypothetical protein